jgi:CMP-N,N'-diacetyllegionaminic acid synthase
MPCTVALIPARSGSKGVPRKNIKQLNGHPLIAYSIQAAQKAKLIDRVIVSTDSPEYAEIAKKYGGEVPFLRPQDIAGDKSSDLEFIDHALNWFRDTQPEVPDLIVHLRPTTPLRDPALIDEAIVKMRSQKNATALRSVHEMSESAYKCFQIESDLLACVCTGSHELDSTNIPRQAFPKTYHANGYVDVLKTSFISKARLMHGDQVIPYITPPTVEVDIPEDFDYLEYQISKQESLFNNLFSQKDFE